MEIIKTIDLWTEQYDNHYECFNGAFIDGFENNKIPFNKYKIVENCNCIITTNRDDIKIRNKNNAIIFYKDEIPVRLMVINKNTDIYKCINTSLNQYFKEGTLKDFYEKLNIQSVSIDMNEKSVCNNVASIEEIDVGSCDRWKLLYNMLKGSYTEDDTSYGNYSSDKYEFLSNIYIKYELTTDTEKFEIEHKCAFINELKTRIVPIQDNSPLTK